MAELAYSYINTVPLDWIFVGPDGGLMHSGVYTAREPVTHMLVQVPFFKRLK